MSPSARGGYQAENVPPDPRPPAGGTGESGIILTTGCEDRQECMSCEVELMHVPRCDTCRRWIRFDSSVGRCGLPGTVDPEGKPQMLIIYAGGEGRLLTAPDFGCVRWEAKRNE